MTKKKNKVCTYLLVIVLSFVFALSFAITCVIQAQNDVYADASNDALVSSDLNKNNNQAMTNSKSLDGWVIFIIVLVAFLGLLVINYFLLFYALNKYVVENGKVIRVFRVSTHEGQIHLLTYTFKMVYRIPEEVYETRQKAENKN